MSGELPHEKHNRICEEIAHRLLNEFPKNLDRLIALESIVSGTISLMCKRAKDPDKTALKILEIHVEGVKERLETHNYGHAKGN